MKQLQFLGLTFLIISLIACGQPTQKSKEKVNELKWKTLDEKTYSIQYPENWELDNSGKMGSSFFLHSKLSTPEDQFSENVNLLIQDMQGQNMNLDTYVEITEEQIKTMMVNGHLIESKRLDANGTEFHKVVFTGDDGAFKLKFEQYYLIKDGKVFILTFTCEIEQFEKYKEVGEKILNSFKLKQNTVQ